MALLLIGCALITALGTLGALAVAGIPPASNRQDLVHERGSAIMPFDLNRTTHVFKTTATGGIEIVIAKDAADSEQIALIQQHLQHEAMQFRAGNFSDPAAIHGANMPGLAELATGAANIEFSYAKLPDGARISYETSDPRLVDALHRWFAAQLTDHGHDASGYSIGGQASRLLMPMPLKVE
jgi:hypothetical protein